MRFLVFLLALAINFAYAYKEGVLIGKKAPDFTFLGEECKYDPDDIYYKENGKWKKRCKEHNLSEILKKGKPVVIVFWAIGDRPGTYYFLPKLNELYEKYKDKVEFMAVLLSRTSQKEVEKAKKLIPLKMPVYRAYSDAIIKYNIGKIDVPYLVFITPDGKIKKVMLRPESPMRYVEDEKGLHKRNGKFDKSHRFDIHQDLIEASIKDIDKYIQELIRWKK